MTRTLQADLLAYLRELKAGGTTHLPPVPPPRRRAVNGMDETTKRRNDEPNGTPAVPFVTPSPLRVSASPREDSPLPPPLRASASPREDFASLAEIAAAAAACRACGLCDGRIQVVPGQGNADSPEIMFVGEGPGADEDAQGLAFVGRSGKLLTQMIEAMGFSRGDVFIANIVKCRPPGNRKPTPAEMDACLPFLRRQIAIVRPRVIVTLGATAAQGLVGEMSGVNAVHGQWRSFDGIPVLLSFHPAYLLRDPSKKRAAWSDLKAVLAKLGRPVPPPAPRPQEA